ncbi:hypothetical protein [uncultured Roseibium sp.]|uniref:hypothetical protein n=1 Tax=uncultured Roseibium sp. TaxID=1936171 RepID=UPI0026061616|nr:hypothetical protein [uncultured Roseibium sp.]
MAKQKDLRSCLQLIAPELLEAEIWLPTLVAMDKNWLFESLRRDLPQVGDLAVQEITLGNVQLAVNWITLGFFCNQSMAREALTSSGTLRASKYKFRTNQLLDVFAALEVVATELSLNTDDLRYLNSMKLLAEFAPEVEDLDQSLRRFLRRNADTALKSVIARVDALFMISHDVDQAKNKNALNSYSKEELAEGASYIIHCINEEIGISDAHFGMMLERKIARGLIDKMILKACKIRQVFEAEMLVEAFNYRCTVTGGKISISAKDPVLEKSIRLGYVQNELASMKGHLERVQAIEDGAHSVFAIADDFFENFHGQVVQRIEVPVSRFTFNIPDVPPIHDLFQNNSFTIEEALYLQELIDTERVTWKELKEFEYRPGLTLLDFSRVHRLFLFISRLAMRQLTPLLESDAELAYRSLVPVFKIKTLKQLLGWCVQKEHVDAVLDFLSWVPGHSDFFDLQYKPILHCNEYCLVPLHITGMTNWYRNMARNENQRLIKMLDTDAAERSVASDLQGARCEFVAQGFETVLEGQRIEIDVICRFGGYLFLFECKHPTLPCNVHELRTSYKHMLKGAQQLGRLKNLLKAPDVEKELYRRLGWEVGPSNEIVTCIVSGNGMFSGLRIEGHPVRRLQELSNMVQTGVIRTMIASMEVGDTNQTIETSELVERKLWNDEKFTPEFLREYLNEDKLTRMLFESMVEFERTYTVGSRKLAFLTYALDTQAFADTVAMLPVANA